jgi:AcrR family transcriptional regulator
MSIQGRTTQRPALRSLGQHVTARTSDGDVTSERILDAAQQRFLLVGIRRTTMDDIAEAAGLGRATLYRRFAGRDDVVLATIAREFERFAHAVEAQMQTFEDPRDRFIEGFVAIVHAAHTHPLLSRLLEADPDLVLPFLTQQGGIILSFNRDFLAGHLRAGQRHGVIREDLDPDEVAELSVRVCHSLLLTPRGLIDAGDRERLRSIARRYLAPILFHDAQE